MRNTFGIFFHLGRIKLVFSEDIYFCWLVCVYLKDSLLSNNHLNLKHKKMTLHEAIEKLLRQTGQSMTTQQIADELNKNGWYEKKDGSMIQAFQIHGRTRNYSNIFERDGSTVLLLGQTNSAKQKRIPTLSRKYKQISNIDKDEIYVLNLCDEILGLSSSRQHKFNFLLGDPNVNGISAKLPVDSYYDELKLVIEYRERQHTESVNFFDKPNRMTISGVHRGEQRKIYDERRRHVLPEYNILLIEISYFDFNHDKQKRIIRAEVFDKDVIKQKLKGILKKYKDS